MCKLSQKYKVQFVNEFGKIIELKSVDGVEIAILSAQFMIKSINKI